MYNIKRLKRFLFLLVLLQIIIIKIKSELADNHKYKTYIIKSLAKV